MYLLAAFRLNREDLYDLFTCKSLTGRSFAGPNPGASTMIKLLILAMLANSLIPFAHERSKWAGLWMVAGFSTSFALT
jgi:hypothetical protein